MELHVKVHKEDGMLWGHVEELPGCFASGAGPGELMEAVEEAVALYLSDGGTSPEPRATRSMSLEELTVTARQSLRVA